MANIDCVIDTHPMANEMNSISHHVTGTTTAVVAMKAAVIKAENDAAEHVCNNVNRGFYTLIRSQISQKTAKLTSEVDSLVMQLQQQTRMLLNIRTRMEHDYNMITARYTKLFGTLNQSLKQRIRELDRPTFDFAERDLELISNRPRQLTATVPVSQLESLTVSQRIAASNVKHHAQEVIDTMSTFLGNMAQQKQLTSRILLPHSVSTPSAQYLLPSIVAEECIDQTGTTATRVVVNQHGITPQAVSATRNQINTHVGELPWQKQSEVCAEVQNEFNRLLSLSKATDRVKRTARDLFGKNIFETFNSAAS
ncbi:MAG: hypothetical protein IJ064_02485 [Bacteroidaceae bacterium]|nr:hypothetical protein [Bacteroidaceae bacterium]